MKTIAMDFNKQFSRIRRAAQNGNADRALRELEEMLKRWPDHPQLLLMKAALIQLAENEGAPPLAEAKRALSLAAKIDGESPEPLTELGHYLLAVEDRAELAEAKFDRAIERGIDLLLRAIHGKVEAIADQLTGTLPAKRRAELAVIRDLIQLLVDTRDLCDADEVGRKIDRLTASGAGKAERNGRNGS